MSTQRERLIASVGIETADRMECLEMEIEAIKEFLGVVRVYGTQGWKLRRDFASTLSKSASDTAQPLTQGK